MSWKAFDDECRGCKPALMDVKTGKVLPDSSPSMKIILQLWSETTLAERQAWHRVTCQNSRSLIDLQFAKDFTDRVQRALTPPEGSS